MQQQNSRVAVQRLSLLRHDPADKTERFVIGKQTFGCVQEGSGILTLVCLVTNGAYFMSSYRLRQRLEHLLKGCDSLRGLSGYVGASSLGATTLKIHAACCALDADYARALLPALRFEWKRARDGLDAFVRRHKAKEVA